MGVDHDEAVAQASHVLEKRVGILEVVEQTEREDRVESTMRVVRQRHRIGLDEGRTRDAEDRPHELALPDVEELAVDTEDVRPLKCALDGEVSLEAADVHDAPAPEFAAKPFLDDPHD